MEETIESQKIYIVLVTDKNEAISKVISSSVDELTAYNMFLDTIESHKKENNLVCHVVNKQLAIISKRLVGWVTSTSEVMSVIQLLSFEL
jgi:hypothetical protein